MRIHGCFAGPCTQALILSIVIYFKNVVILNSISGIFDRRRIVIDKTSKSCPGLTILASYRRTLLTEGLSKTSKRSLSLKSIAEGWDHIRISRMSRPRRIHQCALSVHRCISFQDFRAELDQKDCLVFARRQVAITVAAGDMFAFFQCDRVCGNSCREASAI